MLTVIRDGVFETNSSSMHSIAVRKKHKITTVERERSLGEYLSADGIRSFYSHEVQYGRAPFRILYSMFEKAAYIIAGKARYMDEDTLKSFMEEAIYPAIRKIYPDFKEFHYHKDYDDYYDYGCVDHDSSSLFDDFMDKHQITIEEFLTDSAYIIIIDGDEYCVFRDMLNDGVINKRSFESITTA